MNKIIRFCRGPRLGCVRSTTVRTGHPRTAARTERNVIVTGHRVSGSEHFAVRALADELVDGEPAIGTGHRVQSETLAHFVVVHRGVRCNGPESFVNYYTEYRRRKPNDD